MDASVCYIPSYNDSQRVAESLASLAEWNVVISDNASDEPHRQVLAGMANDRVGVIRHEKSMGRVGNWTSCVEHFLAGGKQWMKFLMAGDLHRPNSLDIYGRAIAAYPQARFIVPQVEIVKTHERVRWGVEKLVLVPPAEIMALAASQGNVLQGLTAPLIHADVLRDGFSFGGDVLSFCADMHFLLNIARRTPTLYVPEIVADFMTMHRKHFAAKRMSLEHYLEEGLLRVRAADALLALTGDQARRNALMLEIVQWAREGLVHRLRDPAKERAEDYIE